MPPIPHYRPTFTEADLQTAREIVRRPTNRQDYVQWAKIALLLAEDPTISNPETGRRLGVHENTIRYGGRSGRERGFASRSEQDGEANRAFPPCEHAAQLEATTKAVACDAAPVRRDGLSLLTIREIADRVRSELALERLAHSTVWRILKAAALKPWQYRSRVFPRDPHFRQRAEVALDLNEGIYEGQPLGPNDRVVALDEKTGLLLRTRLHPTRPPASVPPVGSSSSMSGTGSASSWRGWTCRPVGSSIGWNPSTGSPRSRPCSPPSSIRRSIGKPIASSWWSMAAVPTTARRSPARLREAFPQPEYPELVAVHLPNHASWLNPIELFFSVLARKVLRHFECTTLQAMAEHLGRFIARHNRDPQPYRWPFTKQEFHRLLDRWEEKGYTFS